MAGQKGLTEAKEASAWLEESSNIRLYPNIPPALLLSFLITGRRHRKSHRPAGVPKIKPSLSTRQSDRAFAAGFVTDKVITGCESGVNPLIRHAALL
jgi:hypothetical protein